jgi:hypothetical protein
VGNHPRAIARNGYGARCAGRCASFQPLLASVAQRSQEFVSVWVIVQVAQQFLPDIEDGLPALHTFVLKVAGVVYGQQKRTGRVRAS